MSLAALLQRARSSELASEWPPGAHVARAILDPIKGRVAFVDGGWVYWAAEDGRVHASRPSALQVLR